MPATAVVPLPQGPHTRISFMRRRNPERRNRESAIPFSEDVRRAVNKGHLMRNPMMLERCQGGNLLHQIGRILERREWQLITIDLADPANQFLDVCAIKVS